MGYSSNEWDLGLGIDGVSAGDSGLDLFEESSSAVEEDSDNDVSSFHGIGDNSSSLFATKPRSIEEYKYLQLLRQLDQQDYDYSF